MDKCRLCHRESVEGDYCGYHGKAKNNLVEAYEEWKQSTGISWTDFLGEISLTKEIGAWAKEVTDDLMSIESSQE